MWSKMKTICIISGGTFPVPAVRGGAVEELASLLYEQNKTNRKYQISVVTVFVPELKPLTKKDAGIHAIRIPRIYTVLDTLSYFYWDKIKKDWRAMFYRKKFTHLYYRRALSKFLQKHTYDLVVVENNMSLLSAVREGMGHEAYKKRCLYHAHSVLIDQPASIPYLKSCAGILTVSNYVTKALYTEPELREQKILAVDNGIDVKQFSPEYVRIHRKKYRKKYCLPENAFVYLYSGRISVEKGLRELVEAFENLHMKDAVLLIAGGSFSGDSGRSEYEKDIRKQCADRKLRTVFLGYVPHEKMKEIYCAADCLVIPSLVEEAGPLTALEGAVMGLPVVAPAKGAIREYLGDYAVYFDREQSEDDLTKQMKHVYDHPELRSGEGCRREYFSIEAYNQRFMDAIQDFL